MEQQGPRKLSTSALAKQLEIPTQQLFTTLKDYGWIRKLEQGWALTGKGEFEGGEYVHSKRFGRYIVWPPDLSEHPLLRALEDNRHLAATALGKQHDLSARETNRVLAEQGWIRHEPQGWEVTDLGREKGGVVLENENSGTFYVVWPQTAAQDPQLREALQQTAAVFHPAPTASGELFADQADYSAADGHRLVSTLQLQVCHWLYLAGIAHAVGRRLPVGGKPLHADFYLPAHHLYIECWEDSGEGLGERMARRDLYQHYQFPCIDLEPPDGDQIDEVMTRELHKRGIRIY